MTDDIDDAMVEKALQSWFANRMKLSDFHESWVNQMRATLLAVAPAIREMERQECAEIASNWRVTVIGENFYRAHIEEIANSIAPNIAAAILARGEKQDG